MTRFGKAILAGVVLTAVQRHGCPSEHGSGVPIVMYHAVGSDHTNKWWVSRDVFARHLRALRAEGFRSVTPADVAAHVLDGAPLPAKPVVITLDDGYENAVSAAEPILREHGFIATVYLITGLIADRDSERMSHEGAPCLTWPEVRAAMSRGTLSFGCHSDTHSDLRRVSDPGARICAARDMMAAKTGVAPDSFCYPHGRYNETVVAAVRAAGFTTALTCREGLAGPRDRSALLELPRVHAVGGEHGFFLRRADGGSGPAPVCVEFGKSPPPMAVAARIAPGGQWSATFHAGPEPTTVALIPPVAVTPESIEIWDRFRVLLLHEAQIPPPRLSDR